MASDVSAAWGARRLGITNAVLVAAALPHIMGMQTSPKQHRGWSGLEGTVGHRNLQMHALHLLGGPGWAFL
jgi:predicted HD phosphohydrolase